MARIYLTGDEFRLLQADFFKLARFLLHATGRSKISQKIEHSKFDNRPKQTRLLGMIQLTESAIKAIDQIAKERAEPGQLLRIFISAGGCSGLEYGMGFAHPTEKDIKMEDRGVRFLVDRKSLERLDNSIVDFDDGLSGKGFEIRNPNATSTCGCGKSFN